MVTPGNNHRPPQQGETMTIDDAFQRGFAHHQAGRLQDAENIYRQILNANPNHPETLNFLGLLGHTSGHNAKALDLVERALTIRPDYTHAHIHKGIILNALGQKYDALASFEAARKIEPNAPEIIFNCAAVLQDLRRFEDAAKNFEDVLKIDPNHVRAMNNLGLVYRELGKPEPARELFERMLTLKPDAFEAHFNIGSMELETGNTSRGEQHLRKAIRLNPRCGDAYLSLARLKSFDDVDEDVEAMEAAYAATASMNTEHMPIAFALGKAYEDLGVFDKSFTYYAEGNRLKRTTLNLDFAQLTRDLDHLSNTFTPHLFERFEGPVSSDVTPIFIVGMPRSGSTLVEQILASHPQIRGVGEVTFLPDVIADNLGSYEEMSEKLSAARLADTSRAYLERLRASCESGDYVCDKMLGNFANIGLIKLLFPGAKVIHCRRDPLDTCWSMYKTLFSDQSLLYAYDLTEIGHYYKTYTQLMDHWRDVLGDFIFETEYEQLIADQNGQTRALIDFVGVAWDDACLDFHRTRRSVKTASVTQVRQPIYKSSVKRWKSFEPWLGPLFEALEN